MTKRAAYSRTKQSSSDLGVLIVMALVLVPALAALYDPSPWLMGLVVVVILVGVLGVLAYQWTKKAMAEAHKQRALRQTEDWHALSPKEFEAQVSNLFVARGYSARAVGKTADGGIDVELRRPDGRRAIAQCKRYRDAVGVRHVREFSAVIARSGAVEGYFLATCRFTHEAWEWAKQDSRMRLIDGRRLIEWARDAKFGAYRDQDVRPPLLLSANQWLVVTIVMTGVLSAAGVIGTVMG